MSMLPRRDIVLLGVGHTNAHVLAMWRMSPLPDVRLTCISPFPVATYSGMLPGVLAGDYPPAAMEIDLVRLCAAAGARLISSEADGLDLPSRRVLMRDRPPVPFDVLSVGVGSVPSYRGVTLDNDHVVVTAKPMQTFLARLAARMDAVRQARPAHALRLVVVGGGAAGVELALCLPAFVRRHCGGTVDVLTTLVTASAEVVPGSLPVTATRALAALSQRGIAVHAQRRVVAVHEDRVRLDDATPLEADVVVWVTGASAPPLLRTLGLPTDDRGFLLTDATLRSTSGAPVFAVGDSGTIAGSPLPKAGVFAVRQGPVLWRNIGRVLDGTAPEPYTPQRTFLKLLNTGDGRAIGEWRGHSFEGRLAWRLKDHIDRAFIARYQDYSTPPMTR